MVSDVQELNNVSILVNILDGNNKAKVISKHTFLNGTNTNLSSLLVSIIIIKIIYVIC